MSYRRSTIIISLLLLSVLAKPAKGAELEVSELVASIKRGVIEAQKAAKPPFMEITSLELEIRYVVKKESAGGIRLYVVTAEGRYGTETVHSIKYQIRPAEKPWIVKAPGETKDLTIVGVDYAAGIVFASRPGGPKTLVLPLKVRPNTRILSWSGQRKTIKAITSGTPSTISYSLGAKDDLNVNYILLRKEPKKFK